MSIITYVVENFDEITVVISSVIALAAAVAAITPTQTDNQIVNKIVAVINVLGLNVGKAKNAPDANKIFDKKE